MTDVVVATATGEGAGEATATCQRDHPVVTGGGGSTRPGPGSESNGALTQNLPAVTSNNAISRPTGWIVVSSDSSATVTAYVLCAAA